MTIRELLLRRLSRARMMTLFWAVWLASLVLAAALLNPPLGLLMASTVGAMAALWLAEKAYFTPVCPRCHEKWLLSRPYRNQIPKNVRFCPCCGADLDTEISNGDELGK